MKKMIATAMVTLSLFTFSSRSDAVVGLTTGNPWLIGIGGAITLSCTIAAVDVMDGTLNAPKLALAPCAVLPITLATLSAPKNPTAETGIMLAGAALLWGAVQFLTAIVLLDDQTGSPKFNTLTTEKADLLGITSDELQSMNSEMNSLNAILDEASLSENIEESSQIWLEGVRYLRPATVSALSKITQHARTQLQQ